MPNPEVMGMSGREGVGPIVIQTMVHLDRLKYENTFEDAQQCL